MNTTEKHIKSHFVIAGVTGRKRTRKAVPTPAAADMGTPGRESNEAEASLAAWQLASAKEHAQAEPAPVKIERPRNLAELAALVNVDGFASFTTWQALYNEQGKLSLATACEQSASDCDPEEITLDMLTPGGLKAKKRKAQAAKASELVKACMAHAGESALERELRKWANGELAFYTRGNPARLAGQLVCYDIDSSAPGFMLRTPLEWQRNGYALKATARPIFVITPLFSPEEKAKAEQSGDIVVEIEPEASPESATATKKRKRVYTVHAVFAREDCDQVRTIKRRVRKSGSTRKATPEGNPAEAVAAFKAARMATPAPEPAAIAPAPAPEPATPEAEPVDLAQLLLTL